MAKTQIKTTTIEELGPGEQPEGAPAEAEVDPGVNELMEYIDGIAGSANIVKIYKVVEGRKAWCGTCEPGTITEDAILRKWGGGTYYMLAMNNGHFVLGGTRRIEIFDAPVDPLKAVSAPIENTGQNAGIMMLQDQINRQHEMMLKLIEAQKQPQVSMAEILGMIRDMQAMTPKPPDISMLLPMVTDLFTKTMDVARDSVGGEDSKLGWLKLAAGALEKLPAIIGQVATARGAANVPSVRAMETRGEVGDVDIKKIVVAGGIGWLKKKALAGKPVESVADFLIDNVDDETFGPATMAILNEPFENLGAIDSDVLKEPLRTWFKRLYDELQGAMKNEASDATSGAGGGDSNP